jgi:hypothetical protein
MHGGHVIRMGPTNNKKYITDEFVFALQWRFGPSDMFFWFFLRQLLSSRVRGFGVGEISIEIWSRVGRFFLKGKKRCV